MTIPELLRHWAQATPDAPAMLAPGSRPLTYGELYEQIRRVAARLRSIGIGPDDRGWSLVDLPLGPEPVGAVCVRGRRTRVRLPG